MTEVLAIMGGGTTTLLVVALVWVMVKYISASEERNHAVDLKDAQFLISEGLRNERDEYKARCDVLTVELKREREMRTTAETQRNEAYAKGVNDASEKLKNASAADVVGAVSDLLRMPWKAVSGVRPAAAASGSAEPGPVFTPPVARPAK